MDNLQQIRGEIKDLSQRKSELNQEVADFREQIKKAESQNTENLIFRKSVKRIDTQVLEKDVKDRLNAISKIENQIKELRKAENSEIELANARATGKAFGQGLSKLRACIDALYLVEENLEAFEEITAPHSSSRFETDEIRTTKNLYQSFKNLKIVEALRSMEEKNLLGNAFKSIDIQNQAPDQKGRRKLFSGLGKKG